MSVRTALLLAAVAVAGVHGEYQKVNGECPLLANATGFFDTLLPCASYFTVDGSTDCLSPADQARMVATVPEWTLVKNAVAGDRLVRQFVFDDFIQAFHFMAQGAQLAQHNNHHPLWSNVYNELNVTLTTDDKACLSSFDVDFASGLSLLYKQGRA
eukprot:TRINITY_DN824_c0_g1_i1.p3 TRINITY_DN824_c0_g1~~TRINITY_DN824_c0_g1_i1.p3  ORF type:complete len:156 (+),score=70.06 TRINITY_DN824_c0_g1_i1:60-527(+)